MSPQIAILGGGPAGSAFALHAIRRGVDPRDLVIFDKARFPRPKLCGGGITFRGTRALAELIGRPSGGTETRSIAFRSVFGEVEIFERGPQWLFDRAALDAQLLDACRVAGVDVREETAITELTPGIDGWRVRAARAQQTFRWVIGADGACGISRRASGLRGGRTGRLVEAIYEPLDRADPERLIFDFDPCLDGIPGYAWIFPYPSEHRSGRYKIGVMDGRGRASGEALREWTERFAAKHGYRRIEPKIAGWPERYLTPRTQGHRPGLMLVGEAYGIDPLLGEGIAPALQHAQYAAVRLKGALDAGTDRVSSYEAGFASTLEGRNLWFQGQLADRIYGSAGLRWMRILFALPRLRELAASGADEYGRLARHAPTLIGGYLRYVLTHGLPSARPPELARASA